MALPLPPASSLHAILLITKSRSLGPRLVFHYPPLSPSAAALAAAKDPSWYRNESSTASVDSNSSDSDWDSSTEADENDDLEIGSRTSGRGSGRTGPSGSRDRLKLGIGGWSRQETIDEEDVDDEKDGNARHRGGDYDWNSVLGFKVDALEKILTPSEDYNKRRFELGVESIVFVGAPMFVREDGLWKKLKRRKKKRSELQRIEDGDLSNAEEEIEPEPFIYPPGFEPGYGHESPSVAGSVAASEAGSEARSTSTAAHDDNPDMTMFNVVFVLNPPALEYQRRVKEMYDNVTRKYARALKYEQARFQYVWRESKRIIDIKQRAKENGDSISLTWKTLQATSPLAKSIAILYNAISEDKIAHIHFDATFNTSFQIPQAMSTPYLPNSLEPQMPGLWLTTSNVVLDEEEAPMTQHAALLLLEDPEILIKDLGGESTDDGAAIAGLIRRIVPTKSLLKISKKHNISAHDMQYMASHLVYWRRAQLIDPLSQRDTYIMSPNANMAKLPSAAASFARQFPTLPSLPKFLGLLSGTPRIYKSFIPTYEHRDTYLEVLAWLMRGGWVTQLRTFAWIRVTPEIKAQVAIEMEREERIKKAEEARRELVSENGSINASLFSDKRSSLLSDHTARPLTPMKWRRDRSADTLDEMESSTILSPRVSATNSASYRASSARPSSDAGSNSSQRTTIALNAGRPDSPSHLLPHNSKVHKPSPLHLKPTSPSIKAVTSPPLPVEEDLAAQPHLFKGSLILSPRKASSVEARWLEAIGKTFEDIDHHHPRHPSFPVNNPSPPKNTDGMMGISGKELREQWPMLQRHLDGKHAIEDIAPREGLKRKRVAVLFNAVREKGWLVVVRHW
ncbi:nitrogen permease regulator of amino acid transport activity 3-domain-containing protein [Boeremia exigua]|uniref:nitrogen permease regulator of amino acid transport activity 3-domain-containing protein n=1 Tax=Boeremia exigua TaxID=749465 RepID=UPI001E8E655D|nr:nitrogen permease regulator of amino acid transport activity 3-domain-containing protein [Boeremia exigua]KAH6614850.1 nitrogen permease regulator of amino acid transport activity 3-domain-containing protein [Boeremia exigua]